MLARGLVDSVTLARNTELRAEGYESAVVASITAVTYGIAKPHP